MNDFTKEELGMLKGGISLWTEEIIQNESDKSYQNLYKKLQSMIDNYCEHVWIFHLKLPGSSIECRKCQKVLQNTI